MHEGAASRPECTRLSTLTIRLGGRGDRREGVVRGGGKGGRGWRGAKLGGPGLIFGHAEHIWPLYNRRPLVPLRPNIADDVRGILKGFLGLPTAGAGGPRDDGANCGPRGTEGREGSCYVTERGVGRKGGGAPAEVRGVTHGCQA